MFEVLWISRLETKQKWIQSDNTVAERKESSVELLNYDNVTQLIFR